MPQLLRSLPGVCFKHVLLPTDFNAPSLAAFQTAVDIWHVFQSRLTILHVFPNADIFPSMNGQEFVEMDKLYRESQIETDQTAEAARLEGVACDPIVTDGSVPEAILDTISSDNRDLVNLGTHGFRGFERLMFGSTAETVLRKASCPVVTVGPHAVRNTELAESRGPVVFATDFHSETVAAVRYAAEVCRVSGCRCPCLHILPKAIEAGARSRAMPTIITDALEHMVVENGNSLQSPVYAIRYGNEASTAVTEYATDEKASLVVLGVRKASFTASHLPPHIAYRIIAEAPCPVLTMAFKPYKARKAAHS
jgi:nucleotide-binding universal stress UspA family protein